MSLPPRICISEWLVDFLLYPASECDLLHFNCNLVVLSCHNLDIWACSRACVSPVTLLQIFWSEQQSPLLCCRHFPCGFCAAMHRRPQFKEEKASCSSVGSQLCGLCTAAKVSIHMTNGFVHIAFL